jgi:hypothetical protein
MKRAYLLSLILLGCAGGPSASDPAATGSPILPGEGIGPVTAASTRAELVATLGPERVRLGEVRIGEGFCAPGATIFPDTPEAIDVVWGDSAGTRVARASVHRPSSPWRTPEGVRVGTSLTELERVREGPLRFTGFAWDYGGTLRWSESSAPDTASILMRLVPDSASYAEAESDPRFTEILGEDLVSSEHPLIRQMEIRVESIILQWEQHQAETPCG